MLFAVGFPVASIGMPLELKVIEAEESMGNPGGAVLELDLKAI